ncbi:hypothetical protein B0H13DRAFT_1905879 [Mycena leptocephala]|nr:hypothetical protein B0H13DRAFT_1905879 [Mycena leptocephala]
MAKKSCRRGKFYIYPETGLHPLLERPTCRSRQQFFQRRARRQTSQEKPASVKEAWRRSQGKGEGEGVGPEVVEESASADSLMTQPVPDILPDASYGSQRSARGTRVYLASGGEPSPSPLHPPLSIGPTPSLHSDAYPVPVPELRGNVQWRALLHAYANELPILMHHARSELAEDDLERLRHGEFYELDFSELEGFRAVDAYRWITRDLISLEVLARLEDKSLFLPTDERASPAHTPPPLDLPSLSGAIESSAPLVNDLRARMSLAPNADVDMGPPDVPRALSFGDPMPLLSPQRVVDTSMPAPLSVVADRAALEVGGSTRQPSVARSEVGDIIVNTGGRDESLSHALDSGLGDFGGAPAAEDVSMDVDEGGRSDAETLRLGAIDSREGSFDTLEQEREGSREGTVGAGTAGEKVDSREGSVGAGAASAS